MGEAAPIEAKVTAATVASLAVGILVAVLNGVLGDAALLGGLPIWAQTVLLLAVPTILTYLAGYAAPHTTRPDLDYPNVKPADPNSETLSWRADPDV